jgi:3-phosphoshikimate 1-carboxyvinyltransferase
LNPEKKLSGEISLIGDKSISHRSIIFGSIAEGVSEFSNVLISGDTAATIEIFNSLGVNIEVKEHNTLVIHGVGLNGLSQSKQALDAKSSGTTARLLTGLLARQNFSSELIGSSQLSKRPMGRVINLLTEHGSGIKSNEGYLPIEFEQTESAFNAINTIVPSAQVKSALIIASLYHQEPTVITEDIPTRDHTERILSHMGVGLVRMGSSITVPPNQLLKPTSFRIPSDISSAAFLIAITILSDDKIPIAIRKAADDISEGILKLVGFKSWFGGTVIDEPILTNPTPICERILSVWSLVGISSVITVGSW